MSQRESESEQRETPAFALEVAISPNWDHKLPLEQMNEVNFQLKYAATYNLFWFELFTVSSEQMVSFTSAS